MAKSKAVAVKVGDKVEFLGYSEEVAPEEQLLEAGTVYVVAEVGGDEGMIALEMDNPEFNAKRKESENNAKTLIIDVLPEEVRPASDEDEAEEEAPAPAKAAKKTTAKGKKVAAPEPEEEEEAEDEAEAEEDEDEDEDEEEAPPPKKAVAKTRAKAAPAAKGKAKTAAKPAAKTAAKGKGKAVAKPAPKEAKEEDELAALEHEDEDILELVKDADLLELVSELVGDAAALEYKIGGVLYHVRLSGAYKEADARYKENGGFGLYVKEELNLEYRKAMYLIDIYYKFNLYGISAEKVEELGWTKCAKIAAVMDEGNSEDLLELASESTVADLNDAIKESYKEVGGEKGEKKKRITFKFRLFEDQGTGVTEVLERAAQNLGVKDLSDAFEHIVMEWAAEHLDAKPPKATAKATAKAKPSKRRAAAEEEAEAEA